jgi:hypothetical protein
MMAAGLALLFSGVFLTMAVIMGTIVLVDQNRRRAGAFLRIRVKKDRSPGSLTNRHFE